MPLLTLSELQQKCPWFRGRIGNALGRGLMKFFAVDKINDLYDRNSSYMGPEFAEAVLKDIGVEYELLGADVFSQLPDGPFITISNHPYGHIDGVMLIDIFGHIRPDYKVMVNSFIGRIEALDDNFICVTPTGTERSAPTKDSIQGVREALVHVRAGHPLGIFPAGAISDLNLKDRCVMDREWQEPVIRLIRKLKVPIVPVHFLDRNSDFYYMLGLIDWRVRLLKLFSEVFNKRGKKVRVAIGQIITPERQSEFSDLHQFSDYLRASIFGE